jgi:hypothetical protein
MEILAQETDVRPRWKGQAAPMEPVTEDFEQDTLPYLKRLATEQAATFIADSDRVTVTSFSGAGIALRTLEIYGSNPQEVEAIATAISEVIPAAT